MGPSRAKGRQKESKRKGKAEPKLESGPCFPLVFPFTLRRKQFHSQCVAPKQSIAPKLKGKPPPPSWPLQPAGFLATSQGPHCHCLLWPRKGGHDPRRANESERERPTCDTCFSSPQDTGNWSSGDHLLLRAPYRWVLAAGLCFGERRAAQDTPASVHRRSAKAVRPNWSAAADSQESAEKSVGKSVLQCVCSTSAPAKRQAVLELV